MNTRAWVHFLAMISFAVALQHLLSSPGSLAKAGEHSALPAQAEIKQPGAVGTVSCSGRACHGSLQPMGKDGVQRDEYTKWLLTDKHAQAYLVLLGERSQTIAKNLKLKAAHTAEGCLACHQYPTATALVNRSRLSEETYFGVGCEACHGGAKDWLESHTDRLSAAQKVQQGMTEISDPSRLAAVCAGCHVGSPAARGFPGARDVNHDLLAAGHPRLTFEFSAFLSNLPPHWNEARKIPAPESAARTWSIGQAVSAKAALELLAYRASQATADTKHNSWPEFAEYDCFGCHHDLRSKSWRQETPYPSREPGFLTWGAWYYTMPRLLAEPRYADAPALSKDLDELARWLRKPRPDASRVAEAAHKAIRQIDTPLLEKLAGLHYDSRSLAVSYRRNLEEDHEAGAKWRWDAVSQLYLALAALQEGKQDPQLDAVIRKLLAKSSYPGAGGPHERYDSPRDYQPQGLHEILKPLGD
jgi:hypothetical protein